MLNIWLTSFLRSPLLTAAIRAERVTPSAYHLFPHLITIGGWHGYCIASLLLPLDVLMQFGSAILTPHPAMAGKVKPFFLATPTARCRHLIVIYLDLRVIAKKKHLLNR